jgi:hypothetical protein
VLRVASREVLTELLHRVISYPMFAVVGPGRSVALSVAHKRWSQAEAGKVVVDGELGSLPRRATASRMGRR